MPDPAPIVALVVLLLLHVPPGGVLVSVRVPPRHTVGVPVIAVGIAFTVIVAVAKQLVGNA